MRMTWLVIVQWLHIVAGIAWIGGHITDHFLLTAVLRQPAAKARETYEAVGRLVGPVMPAAGSLVLLLGILRGTWLGPIDSLRFLFTTAYGLTWLAALVITIVVIVRGATQHDRLPDRIWNGDQVRAGAAHIVRTRAMIDVILFGTILATMVLMRFGL